MKISQKILLGFLLVFVLISLSGVRTSIDYGRILDTFGRLMDHDLAAIDTVEEMEKVLLEMNFSILLHEHMISENVRKGFQDGQRHWISLRNQLAENINTDPVARKLLIQLDQATQEWINSAERKLLSKGEDPLILPVLDTLRPLYRKLLTHQRSRLYESYNSSKATIEQVGELAWTLRAGAVVVGLLTCAIVVQSVKGPLDRLIRATEDIAAGRFEPLTTTSKDEISKLTHSFNSMSRSLKERTQALEEQRRLAIQASELKTEFLANTSHELRTPLNTIIGYTQLILEGLARNKEEEQGYLRTIQQSSKHLLALINDVLDIARIESGQMKLELEPVLIRGVFDPLEKHMRLPAQKKKLSLHVRCTPEDLCVRANPGRLNQVLLNIVGNAIKFTETGQVEISAEPDEKTHRVLFTVRDTGVGVPKEKQSLLFQKFVQTDGSLTRARGGTGLGLALSRTLLNLMKGTIELQSEGHGKGTTVIFTLPRETDLR